MEVACGQCIGCRLDRSRVWAVRIIHECSLHEMDEGNCFITLTYDDEHVPEDWSLRKSDFQKFMKRLRKGHRQRIRFFHVGEYGKKCKHCSPYSERTVEDCEYCNVGRPHYHAVLFNCSFRDLEPVGSSNGVVYYTSARLQSFWPHGFVQVGDVTFESAAYVSRYVLKKRNGELADSHYVLVDQDGVATWVLPEYCTMSRRPGIGREWYEKYKEDVFPSDEVPVPGVGVLKGVPRYYEELLAEEDEAMREEVKAVRALFMKHHAQDYTPERLMDRYKVKCAQAKMLEESL